MPLGTNHFNLEWETVFIKSKVNVSWFRWNLVSSSAVSCVFSHRWKKDTTLNIIKVIAMLAAEKQASKNLWWLHASRLSLRRCFPWLLNNFAFSHFHFLKSGFLMTFYSLCYILKHLLSDKFACGICTHLLLYLWDAVFCSLKKNPKHFLGNTCSELLSAVSTSLVLATIRKNPTSIHSNLCTSIYSVWHDKQ